MKFQIMPAFAAPPAGATKLSAAWKATHSATPAAHRSKVERDRSLASMSTTQITHSMILHAPLRLHRLSCAHLGERTTPAPVVQVFSNFEQTAAKSKAQLRICTMQESGGLWFFSDMTEAEKAHFRISQVEIQSNSSITLNLMNRTS